MRNHYYEPTFTDRTVTPTETRRQLPGIDLSLDRQVALLRQFTFAEELDALDGQSVNGLTYHFTNANRMFAEGDAEALYSFIRAFKPATIVEIGSGQSSLVAQIAIGKNKKENPHYACRHVCFEPYENPWLEQIGAEIMRARIETADLSLFLTLQPNDIVFIDSSHVLRPQGDVECEILRILPVLAEGVFVHVHDIFTPFDYIPQFLCEDRRFWTEQYILEAFLSMNSCYEVVLALHDLHRRRLSELSDSFPVLARSPHRAPGSFWMRRKAA